MKKVIFKTQPVKRFGHPEMSLYNQIEMQFTVVEKSDQEMCIMIPDTGDLERGFMVADTLHRVTDHINKVEDLDKVIEKLKKVTRRLERLL